MDFQTLNRLFRRGMEYGHARIRECGLTDTEHMITTYVYAHGGCSQDDAVRALRIDKTTLAKALRALEEKGFIRRGQHPRDRRRNALEITEAGRESIAAIIGIRDEWMRGVMSALNVDEQRAFDDYCARLLKRADELLPGDAAAVRENFGGEQ